MITENLEKALNHIYSISFAEIDENKTSCASFNIEPFNGHWDRQTVIEVKESVQRYLKTWVLPKILEEAGEEGKIFQKKKLIEYHKNQIMKLEFEIDDSN